IFVNTRDAFAKRHFQPDHFGRHKRRTKLFGKKAASEVDAFVFHQHRCARVLSRKRQSEIVLESLLRGLLCSKMSTKGTAAMASQSFEVDRAARASQKIGFAATGVTGQDQKTRWLFDLL